MKYSGVVHMHSAYSYDAKLSLGELKTLLVQEGISFACMTEHTNEMTVDSVAAFVAECRALSDESFVFVPGFEVPYFQEGMKKDTHVLLIGCESFVCQYAREAKPLRDFASRAALCIMAHPSRNFFKIDAVLEELIDGVEIWNQQYDGKRVPRTRSYALLEDLRKEKPKLLATGGLDLHRAEHLTFPRHEIELEALSESAIVDGLKSGLYQFGHKGCMVNGTGGWRGVKKIFIWLQSFISTAIIYISKQINKGLASLGLSLPKSLKQSIRSRI